MASGALSDLSDRSTAYTLAAFTSKAIIVAAARAGFEPHAITTRIGRPVRNAVLDDMNVDTATKGSVQPLPLCALDNLLDREICGLGMIAMEQCSRDPNFVRHLQVNFSRCTCHDVPPPTAM
jgi:hypothetical protein